MVLPECLDGGLSLRLTTSGPVEGRAYSFHFCVASSSHSATTWGSGFLQFACCSVCFKSRGEKAVPEKHKVRERRECARDSEKAHTVYSKCNPILVPTTKVRKLDRK